MLGYVKVNKPMLRFWEYDVYKAFYCSICKVTGKKYGIITRFTLSYDFTFLALLTASLDERAVELKKGRCACNPLKACKYCKGCADDKNVEFSAAAAVIFTYYKIIDNVADKKGIAKLLVKVLKKLFEKPFRKAKADYPEVEEIVAEFSKEQFSAERDEASLDEAAHPTAKALGKVFVMCGDDDSGREALYNLGYNLGKYIYTMDCTEDIQKDIKSGNFNPLKDRLNGTFTVSEALKVTEPILNATSVNAGLSLENLEIKKYKGILDNIIYDGLRTGIYLLHKKEKIKNEKRRK